jgi:hypothetical protein
MRKETRCKLMDRSEMLSHTLKNQYLLEKADKATVVSDLCGLQAQFANNPKYALRIRASDFMEDTWNEGLAKIWSFRGTLHMVKIEEIGLYLSARGLKSGWEEPRWGLDEGTATYWSEYLMACIAEGIQGREELKARCREKGISQEVMDKVFHGWGGLVREMCDRGMIAYESGTAKRFLVCRDLEFMDRDDARAILIQRYFRAFAPATMEDCARFTGYPKREILRLVAGRSIPLRSVTVEGVEYFHLDDLQGNGEIPRCLFLAGFDQMVMGYQDRSRFMDDRNKSDVVTTTGIIHPTILLHGKLKAKWRKERTGIGITPFGPLGIRDRKAITSKALEVFAGEIRTVTFHD